MFRWGIAGGRPADRTNRHAPRMVLQRHRHNSARAQRTSRNSALRGRRRRRSRNRRNLSDRRRRPPAPRRHGLRQRILRPRFRKKELPESRRLETAHARARSRTHSRSRFRFRRKAKSPSNALGKPLWTKNIRTGETEMCHSLRNMEHHHFKYETHRRPGDVHVHFFGADCLSFGEGIRLAAET